MPGVQGGVSVEVLFCEVFGEEGRRLSLLSDWCIMNLNSECLGTVWILKFLCSPALAQKYWNAEPFDLKFFSFLFWASVGSVDFSFGIPVPLTWLSWSFSRFLIYFFMLSYSFQQALLSSFSTSISRKSTFSFSISAYFCFHSSTWGSATSNFCTGLPT